MRVKLFQDCSEAGISTVGAMVDVTRSSRYAKGLQLGRRGDCESVRVGIHKHRAFVDAVTVTSRYRLLLRRDQVRRRRTTVF